MKKEYALYKGDELLGIGTAEELARMRNVRVNTILYMRTPTYRKRHASWNSLALVPLEDEA